MKTLSMLMVRYDFAPAIDLEIAAKDWLGLDKREAYRAEREGRLPFPVVRGGESQRSPRKVMLEDLARYIEQQARTARVEYEKLAS